ncbi:hypothetical protein K488DRAFT_83439 [Vararia minispora EC-137]|uniref:Uncharacterized protein n=1 Tax=Vararia minispora EC-137 TaxID=1314806 RepID=A0ACB8QTI1_9AGAM|nr:hypothetical protein K488DRAFT_83439 [Vararia minispora EC-137]
MSAHRSDWLSNCIRFCRSKIILSWDVLITLSEHLPRDSLIALMSTCKQLRRYGVRFLLGEDRPISFRSPNAIDSLCLFMNSNIPKGTSGRAAHIRMLDLHSYSKLWSYKNESFHLLGNVLRQATGLYALQISEEALLSRALSIELTAERLPFSSLRRLCLVDPGVNCLQFLESISDVPLEVLVVNRYRHAPPGGPDTLDRIARLFQDSLEELHVSNCTRVRDRRVFNGVCLPHVHTVSLLGEQGQPFEAFTEHLIHTFPNATRVTLSTPPGSQPLPTPPPFPHREIIPMMPVAQVVMPDPAAREVNERTQRRTRWQSLDYLCSTLANLHTLALRAQVEHLVVTAVALTRPELERMHVVVRDCAPTRLTIVVGAVRDKTEELIALVPRNPPRPLRYLQIDLSNWVSADSLLSELCVLRPSLGSIRTFVLRMAAGVEMQYRNPLDAEAAYEEYEKFALQCVGVAHSLRHVGLPDDLFGPLPKTGPEPTDVWMKLDTPPRPKETLFWSIDRVDDALVYADKVPRKAAEKLLESETYVASSPFQ